MAWGPEDTAATMLHKSLGTRLLRMVITMSHKFWRLWFNLRDWEMYARHGMSTAAYSPLLRQRSRVGWDDDPMIDEEEIVDLGRCRQKGPSESANDSDDMDANTILMVEKPMATRRAPPSSNGTDPRCNFTRQASGGRLARYNGRGNHRIQQHIATAQTRSSRERN